MNLFVKKRRIFTSQTAGKLNFQVILFAINLVICILDKHNFKKSESHQFDKQPV